MCKCINDPIKRMRLAEWIQKTDKKRPLYMLSTKKDLYICCLQEIHLRPRGTYRLKVRGQKMAFHANGNQKKAGVAILTSVKTD